MLSSFLLKFTTFKWAQKIAWQAYRSPTVLEGDYFKIISQASSIFYRPGKLMSTLHLTGKTEGIPWKAPNLPTAHLQVSALAAFSPTAHPPAVFSSLPFSGCPWLPQPPRRSPSLQYDLLFDASVLLSLQSHCPLLLLLC